MPTIVDRGAVDLFLRPDPQLMQQARFVSEMAEQRFRDRRDFQYNAGLEALDRFQAQASERKHYENERLKLEAESQQQGFDNILAVNKYNLDRFRIEEAAGTAEGKLALETDKQTFSEDMNRKALGLSRRAQQLDEDEFRFERSESRRTFQRHNISSALERAEKETANLAALDQLEAFNEQQGIDVQLPHLRALSPFMTADQFQKAMRADMDDRLRRLDAEPDSLIGPNYKATNERLAKGFDDEIFNLNQSLNAVRQELAGIDPNDEFQQNKAASLQRQMRFLRRQIRNTVRQRDLHLQLSGIARPENADPSIEDFYEASGINTAGRIAEIAAQDIAKVPWVRVDDDLLQEVMERILEIMEEAGWQMKPSN